MKGEPMTKTLRSARQVAVQALALATILSSLAGLGFSMAHAEYPERVITAIVPFAAGGANDIVARVVTPYLTSRLGQSVVVQNRPGAAGNVGILAAAQAKPDGYTILFSATASTQNPALFKMLPFDPLKDIVPVAELAEGPYAVFVKASSPVHTFKDLIEVARNNPGKLNGSAGGIGTRLSIELFNLQYCSKAFQVCGLCRFCRNGMETACRKRKSVRGGYAEFVALHEEVLVRFPDTIGFDVACMLGVATGVALSHPLIF
jgi:NADPH:quinone reductase-like Zn-dependent oxidoreductase